MMSTVVLTSNMAAISNISRETYILLLQFGTAYIFNVMKYMYNDN